MTKLLYTVPSRIAINLYDMNGSLGRIDGGMGFSLEHPKLVFEVENANSIQLKNVHLLGSELSDAVKKSVQVICKEFEFGGVQFDFRETIPSHSGFGSKTATLLSIAHAYGKIHGVDLDFRELGRLLHRGGTSGLGINLIDKGGFILEGGHSTRNKLNFAPSSAAKEVYPAPLLAYHNMPDWDILLVVPEAEKIYGEKETSFFRELCPLPERDIEKVARITLSQVLPGVVESDLETFARGISNIQQRCWKANEINIYGDIVKNTMKYLAEQGVRGIGMSSIGPGIFGFGENLTDIANMLKSAPKYMNAYVTKPNNTGFRIEEIK